MRTQTQLLTPNDALANDIVEGDYAAYSVNKQDTLSSRGLPYWRNYRIWSAFRERRAEGRSKKEHSLQIVKAPVLEQLGVPGDSLSD